MAIARNDQKSTGRALVLLGLTLSSAVGCTAFGATEPSSADSAVDTPAGTESEPDVRTPRTVNRVEPPPGPDDLLADVDRLLATADYAAAADICRQITTHFPTSAQAAQALFQLAVLHWNPASPTYDPAAAFITLQRVTQEYPKSPWAPAAGAVLRLSRDKAGLERALATLQAQLDELKALDLEPPG